MGLISRVSSRTYRNLPQPPESIPIKWLPNKHAPTPLSSSRTRAWKSAPITSKSLSRPPAFRSSHSGLVSLQRLLRAATLPTLSPTSAVVSAVEHQLLEAPPLEALPRRHLRKKRRRRKAKKSPTPTWALTSLDKGKWWCQGDWYRVLKTLGHTYYRWRLT